MASLSSPLAHKTVSDRLARRRSPGIDSCPAHAGAHLLLDQYSTLDAALERAAIFRKVLQEMGADSSERQIALAETPDGDDKASIMHFKGPEEAIDGALIGALEKIHARVDAIPEGGVEGLHSFSRKFIAA